MFHNQFLIPEMKRLRRFSMRLTKDKSRSDDLLQATLLRALENRDKFLEGSNLLHWTSKIMFNLFVTEYRRQKKFISQYDPEPLINKLYVASNQEHCTDIAIVNEQIQKLPKPQRDILVMVCVYGYSYVEVAGLLGVPIGTVRSRLSRARTHLSDLLNPIEVAANLPVRKASH